MLELGLTPKAVMTASPGSPGLLVEPAVPSPARVMVLPRFTWQENWAKAVVAGEQAARTPRFVKTTNGSRCLGDTGLARARALVGLEGYVPASPRT